MHRLLFCFDPVPRRAWRHRSRPGRRRRLGRRQRRDHAPLPGAAAVRHERSSGTRAAGGGLPEAGARSRGHPGRDRRQHRRAAEPDRAPEGLRREASAADHGPHRHGERGPEEVDPSAVLGHARRRLRVRTRHGRRQGQPRRRAHGDVAAETQRGRARPRRDLPRGGGGGRLDARRHPVRHQRALSEGRGGVLPGRRRRRHPQRRRGPIRVGADAREDPPRDRADRARACRAWIGAAAQQRGGSPLERGRQDRRVEDAGPAERDDTRVLQAACGDLSPGAGDGTIAASSATIRPRWTRPTSTSWPTSRVTRR